MMPLLNVDCLIWNDQLISDFSRLYRTGDFGVLQKGVILYAGRTDSQIKIRGHRVDLQEVDRAVAGVDGVDKCKYLAEIFKVSLVVKYQYTLVGNIKLTHHLPS